MESYERGKLWNVIPTQTQKIGLWVVFFFFYQWYQSSQPSPSHPIMGLPSSGLLHPGQIQIWFPHSSRIFNKNREHRSAQQIKHKHHRLLRKRLKQLIKAQIYHISTDGLSHYAADRGLGGGGGGQQGGRGQQWRHWGQSRRQRGGRRRQRGSDDRREYRGRQGCPRTIPRTRLGRRSPGPGSLGLWVWDHLADHTDGQK